MKYAQIVMGAAGTGKSTYCHALQEHCNTTGRAMRVINLDPAAETFKYTPSFDIRELISVDDVMEEMHLGPNGALVYCMEYLVENMEWLSDNLDGCLDEDYFLIDCPGQIELYSHIPVMRQVVNALRAAGFAVCGVYLIDALFITDASKFIAGNLAALAAMMHLELPHLNVLTKCDLVKGDILDRYLSPSGADMVSELSRSTSTRYKRLNAALASLLDDYDMVNFLPLDITKEESLEVVLQHIDNAIQFGEDAEPREPKDEAADFEGADDDDGGAGALRAALGDDM